MIKGILLCFLVLGVQLALLHLVDRRMSDASSMPPEVAREGEERPPG